MATRWMVRIVMTAVVLAPPARGGVQLKYMSLFTDAEAARPHVEAPSIAVPHDFVDGQWEGIIAASDGKTYFSVSSHSPTRNAQFYRYDPAVGKVEPLIDVGKWCGETDSIGKRNTQGKIHSMIYEADGKLYCSTTSAHASFEHPYRGGHFLSYDLKTGRFTDLGLYPSKAGGLLTMVYEPLYKRLYAINQYRNTLLYYDLTTGKTVTIGSIQDGMQCRVLITDPRGVVYGSDWGGMIWRYDPKTRQRSCLLTRIPHDPQAPQPKRDPKSRGWMKTMWANMVWDPKTRWWYGVRGNDEYLFRFRPPADPTDHRGRIEGLAQIGYRPSKQAQPRYASLGLALRGRTLYYCSYPIWRSMAHLTSYNIDTGRVAVHGPIVTTDRRRVSEIHSMVVGSDGKLHAVAMVWSIRDKDPAQPWANRASCFFHARFVTIDPATDFKLNADAPAEKAGK